MTASAAGTARSRVRHVVVGDDRAGQRIDNFLARELPRLPRTALYRILRTGQVRVNGARVRQSHRLAGGDDVRIPPVDEDPNPPARPAAPAWSRRVEGWIIAEHRGWLALDKPSGIAVHGGSGVAWGVIEALRAARPREGALELVHRLDRDTSGCLLIARRRSALRRLHDALRHGDADKRYLLMVHGRWPRSVTLVDEPLSRFTLRGGERVVRPAADGRAAQTRFRVLATSRRATLLEARPLTGRTHQIRVHAALTGHAIAGDSRYGTGPSEFRALGLDRLYLHASSIEFPDPAGGEGRVRVRAPVPEQLRAVAERLGLEAALADRDDGPAETAEA